MAKKHTNISLDAELHEWVKQQADNQKRSVTNYIEIVLTNHKNDKQPAQVMRRGNDEFVQKMKKVFK